MKHKIKSLENYEICYVRNLYYNIPISKVFVLTTDASSYVIGDIWNQGMIGKDLSIAYTSRLLNKDEQNYSTIEKELSR